MSNIGVVLVTYNRISMLKKTLLAFDKQSESPQYILVIDNASTDGTDEFLRKWIEEKRTYNKNFFRTSENLGGSGGFYTGLKIVTENYSEFNAEWIYVSDDDAFPEYNCIENARKYIDDLSVPAICAEVLNQNTIDSSHRRIISTNCLQVKEEYVPASQYNHPFYVNSFSFVGVFLNIEYIRRIGLPEKNYFIWYDDTEYSYRLCKDNYAIVCPDIIVHHDVNYYNTLTWKDYYGTRNKGLMIKKNFSFRYYFFYCCFTILKSFIRIILKKNPKKIPLEISGIVDSILNRQGIHKIYRPGWKPSSK